MASAQTALLKGEQEKRVLILVFSALTTILLALCLVAATPLSAQATLLYDKYDYPSGDDTFTFEVTKVTMYGEQGTVRLSAFVDRGEPTTDVTFPSSIFLAEGYYPVTAIAGNVFRGDPYLESVTIPDSVVNIGSYAFSDCENLESVTIPDSAVSIGAYAFNDCESLATIDFGSGVKEIGGYAFHNCGTAAETPGTLVFPATLEDIKQDAFSGSAFTGALVIPDAVTHIGADAFANCPGFTSLAIGNGLVSLSSGAFQGCTGLVGNLVVPDTVTAIYASVFKACTGITSVTLGGNLSVLAGYAFQGCTSLETVTIPASVTTFGDYAFQGCTSLSNLTLANGLTLVGDYAFAGCTALETIAWSNSLNSIGEYAFNGCTQLETLNLPNSITSIGKRAFYQCAGLRSLDLPDSLKTIGESAFRECSGINSPITIPGTVTSFGKYAFQNCSRLPSVTFGNGLTSISNAAFYNCASLSSLTIPEGVSSIGGQAFDGCTGLRGQTLTLPSSLKYAYNQTFGNRYFTTIVNTSTTAFDHYSFLKPDDGQDLFYVDASGSKVTSLGTGTFTLGNAPQPNPDTPNIDKPSIANATVSGVSDKTYTGKAITQKPTVKLDGKTLVAGTDYTLSYKDNTNAGTATMTVTGKGAYTGKKNAAFAIAKASSSVKIAAQAKTYTGKALAYSGKVTKSGSSGKVTYDYYSDAKCKKAVKKANVKNVGLYYVKATLAADANHKAATSAAAKFTINPKGTSLTSLKASAGGFTAKWSKQAAQTTGYQLMYATDAKFSKGKKSITIAKPGTVSKKVTGLKAKTKYYVKVRTYKKVGTKTYYAAWSKAKSVTVPKG